MDRHKEINDAGGNGKTGNCSTLSTYKCRKQNQLFKYLLVRANIH